MSEHLPQRTETGWLPKTLAFVLVLVFLLALPLSLLAFDVWRVVFNPPLIKKIIAEEVIQSDLIPVALEWFSHQRAQQRVDSGEALAGVNEPDIILLMSFLDREDWRAIKQEVLPDEILIKWTAVAVEGVYAWIDSDERVPQITWDLTPFIQRVNSEHGTNAILIAYDKLPPCTQTEIDDFTHRQALAPGTEVLYNLCEFPAPWHDDQIGDYKNALANVVKSLPPEFALTDELARVADRGGAGPEALKRQLRLIRTLGMLAWVLPLLLVLLIAGLAVRSLTSLAQWLGVPLMVGGFEVLLPALAARRLINNVLSTGVLSETPEAIRAEVLRVIGRVADEIFGPMLIEAIILIGVSVGLIVWYWVKESRPQSKP